MSGNHALDIGEITQSTIKGKAMESALAKTMNDAKVEMPKKVGKKEKK